MYDLTLKIAQPWRRTIPTAPALFVAINDASLAGPELTALPRPLFQPIWARLIDALIEAGARRVAFDMVFAYAGADFRIGSYTLPDYDQSLISSLARGRDRIVLGRFPSVAPATPFVRALGASRIGVLDLQLESDGRVRSTAPITRLADGRIALGFAALGAGLSIRQASSLERILITPDAPLGDTPTYSLASLLACLSSPEGIRQVREAVADRIVVIGTAVLGEDEHRGPTRFMGHPMRTPPSHGCAPQTGLFERPEPENGPGALLQIAAIQSAASERPVTLAATWLRLIAGAGLALLFAVMAFQEESALTIGERDAVPTSRVLGPAGSIGLPSDWSGPALLGLLICAAAFVLADVWLPMGYPIVATNAGVCDHRGLAIGPPPDLLQAFVPHRRPLFAPREAGHARPQRVRRSLRWPGTGSLDPVGGPGGIYRIFQPARSHRIGGCRCSQSVFHAHARGHRPPPRLQRQVSRRCRAGVLERPVRRARPCLQGAGRPPRKSSAK